MRFWKLEVQIFKSTFISHQTWKVWKRFIVRLTKWKSTRSTQKSISVKIKPWNNISMQVWCSDSWFDRIKPVSFPRTKTQLPSSHNRPIVRSRRCYHRSNSSAIATDINWFKRCQLTKTLIRYRGQLRAILALKNKLSR